MSGGEQAIGRGQSQRRNYGERSNDVTDKLPDAGSEMYEQARESFEQGRRAARYRGEDVERYVREKPLRSLLIAAGVGWLIGAIWRRL